MLYLTRSPWIYLHFTHKSRAMYTFDDGCENRIEIDYICLRGIEYEFLFGDPETSADFTQRQAVKPSLNLCLDGILWCLQSDYFVMDMVLAKVLNSDLYPPLHTLVAVLVVFSTLSNAILSVATLPSCFADSHLLKAYLVVL